MFGYLALMGCCLPFFADCLVNGIWLGTGQATQGTATVEELGDASDYQKQNDDADIEHVDPSDRILPESLRENEVTRNLLSRNWKDGASDPQKNSLNK